MLFLEILLEDSPLVTADTAFRVLLAGCPTRLSIKAVSKGIIPRASKVASPVKPDAVDICAGTIARGLCSIVKGHD